LIIEYLIAIDQCLTDENVAQLHNFIKNRPLNIRFYNTKNYKFAFKDEILIT